MSNKKKKNTHQSVSRKISGTDKQLEKQVFSSFKARTGMLKKFLANREGTLEDHDLCEPWLSRRIKAVCAELPAYIERYSAKYPGTDIADEFSLLCAASRAIPDDAEQDAFYSLGAALWILDRLYDERKMTEALEILPRDVQYADVETPFYYDISHSEEVVDSLLLLIQHKNDDINKNYKVKTKYFRPRYIFDYAAATGNTDTELHRQYRCVLDLIPHEAIETAVLHFKEKCIEWLDIYFDELSERSDRIRTCKEKIVQLEKKSDTLREKLENELKAAKKPTPAIGPLNLNVLQSASRTGFDQRNKEETEVFDMLRCMEEAESEMDELLEYQTKLLFWAADAKILTLKKMSEVLGEKTARRFADFNVDDPYEICFALFYLIEIGDDLPWLYAPVIAVLNAAAAKLPWGIDEYDECEDYVWHPEEDTFGSCKEPSVQDAKKITDEWLDIKYRTDFETDIDSEYWPTSYRNLAQIVYEKTGAVMPRNLYKYEAIRKDLKKSGLTPKQITSLLPLLSVLGEIQRQTKSDHYYDDYSEMFQPKADDTEFDIEKSEAEIKRLRGEIKKLQQSLHDSHYEIRKANEMLEKAEEEMQSERQELADLRELIFNKQDESYLSEKVEEDISFPYETVGRTVVFGGHDTWVKEIKPKLPNVRFIDRGAIPNAEMIRHADIVWVQTNAIPHMFYNTIIDQVRKHNIPVRYFTYSSAAKCAEQIVREDRE